MGNLISFGFTGRKGDTVRVRSSDLGKRFYRGANRYKNRTGRIVAFFAGNQSKDLESVNNGVRVTSADDYYENYADDLEVFLVEVDFDGLTQWFDVEDVELVRSLWFDVNDDGKG